VIPFRLRRASLALLLSLAPPILADATGADILDAINQTCVPVEELVLAGIGLGDDRALVESRLGAASRHEVVGPANVLEADGLRVRFHASRVQSVVATASNWSTASGIRPGQLADRVAAILGFDLDSIESPHSKSPSHYQIHRCVGPNEQVDVEQYLRLGLSAGRVIATVEIFWVAP
jgi:hypothetical protein